MQPMLIVHLLKLVGEAVARELAVKLLKDGQDTREQFLEAERLQVGR